MLYPVYETNDSFAYDFEALKKMIDEEQPKIMLVASPNNPTGNGLTVDELELLAQMLPATSVMLVDEAYASYVTSDISYIKDMIERHPNIIFCRTLSKFYGLPGLRWGLGFVGKGEMTE